MIQMKMKSDLSILDGGLNALTPMVDKTMEEATDSIINRIRYNWSSSSPSTPGEPPAVVTGTLDESVTKDNTGRNARGQFASGADITAWYIRVEAPYANALEYGDSSKNLEPRPFIAPAILAEQDEIGDKFEIGFRGIWK